MLSFLSALKFSLETTPLVPLSNILQLLWLLLLMLSNHRASSPFAQSLPSQGFPIYTHSFLIYLYANQFQMQGLRLQLYFSRSKSTEEFDHKEFVL